MKLQILIPQYEETDKVIKPLLDSIAIQQNVDLKNEIGVIIVNDGSNVHLSNDLLNSYPFKIKYYLNEHKGVSATRNACLDYATAEYVMFCDADDMFYNACGLWIIFNEMEKDFDTMFSIFLEEGRNPENKEDIFYHLREMDSTFVHGKVHKRQYLIDEDIRWNDKLTIHEDSYFNIQCQRLTEKVVYCTAPFYLWKWRDNSVCRHDPKYMLKTFNNFIDSSDACVARFIDKNRKDIARSLVTQMVYDCYFNMNKKEWLDQENQEYRNATELRFKDYYTKYEGYYKSIMEEEKYAIVMGIKNRMFQEGLMMENITFDDWIKHIKNLKKKK